MDAQYRIKQYIGGLHSDVVVREKDLSLDPHKGLAVYQHSHYRGRPFPKINGTYYHDMARHLDLLPHLHDTRFVFLVGDAPDSYNTPTLVKTRPIDHPRQSVLMDLDHPRHFNPLSVADGHDRPYPEKKDVLVWRGATTGPGFDDHPNPRETSRSILVARHTHSPNPVIDIGLSGLTETIRRSHQSDYYSQFLKPSLPLPEMLSYKFHLSVEGHDVATNLKWVLHSQSVPFCPPFYIQSWILENELQPWTHYIPVRGDYSDLDEKVGWATHHPDQCAQIAQEGHNYMQQFLDLETEQAVRQAVLEHYAKHVVLR